MFVKWIPFFAVCVECKDSQSGAVNRRCSHDIMTQQCGFCHISHSLKRLMSHLFPWTSADIVNILQTKSKVAGSNVKEEFSHVKSRVAVLRRVFEDFHLELQTMFTLCEGLQQVLVLIFHLQNCSLFFSCDIIRIKMFPWSCSLKWWCHQIMIIPLFHVWTEINDTWRKQLLLETVCGSVWVVSCLLRHVY